MTPEDDAFQKIIALAESFSDDLQPLSAHAPFPMPHSQSSRNPKKSTPRLSDHLDEIFAQLSPDDHNNPDENTTLGWDWPGWLLPGFLTILAGQPDSGKSSLCLHLALTYHDGRPWPDGAPFTNTLGKTLWVEHNDDPRVQMARLRSWGMEHTRPGVLFLNLPYPEANAGLMNPHDLHHLANLAHRPDIRLIILDSLDGLLASAGSPHLIHDLFITLTRIARFVKKPILLTCTLRQPPTLDRSGRINLTRLLAPEIYQVPCVIWALDLPDLARPTHRRLSVIKNNLAAYPDPLGFHIDDHGLHFSPLSPSPSHPSQLALTINFLQVLLAGGPLPATQVIAAAAAADHALPTLKRAKKQLRIKSHKQLDQWLWQLPSQ